MVTDGATEQIKGKFADKRCEANCHLTQIEPYSTLMNCVGGYIHELMKGLSREMIKTGDQRNYSTIVLN